jgi:maltooligosyltrehalose trehalohydrolase
VRFCAFTSAPSCCVQLVDREQRELSRHELTPLGGGYFELLVRGARAGALYFFVVAGRSLPDPYARSLPLGVHGPAEVVEPSYAFRHLPPARPLAQQVIYELHVGTFTEQGTFAAARERLPQLVELGVTTLELMPVAAFAGERGWGYDGVALYAPHRAYGTLDELRELIDAAHGLGLSVLLDVVYNHFGPSGNYLAAYAPSYFSRGSESAWGRSPDFTDPALRQLVLDNARFWLRDMGFDGLRLDATHAIFDPSARHVLAELADIAHELAPPQLVIAEDERNRADLVSSLGLDALWADDFHHQLRVCLTGESQGYYADFRRSVPDLAELLQRGWLYTGQQSRVQGRPRGAPADTLAAEAFVYCIQNHDQVGNRALGDRLSQNVAPNAYRAASLLLLFLPMTPLLFMGQEWGARTPFLYFTDHEADLGEAVKNGRRREFPEFADPNGIPDPQAVETFRASKLRWQELDEPEARRTLDLYRSALSLRKTDEVLARGGRSQLSATARGNVLVVQRHFGASRRTLLMSFGNAPVDVQGLALELGLHRARPLLSSSTSHDSLGRHDAIILASEHQPEEAP